MLEIRLRQLLEKHGLYKHGIAAQIAKGAGINRHTVERLLNEPTYSARLDVIRKVANWCMANGVPNHALTDLFGIGPSSLAKALVSLGRVNLCTPSYRLLEAPTATWHDVAQPDVEAASLLTGFLAGAQSLPGSTMPHIKFRWVPFNYQLVKGKVKLSRKEEAQDEKNAKALYQQLQKCSPPATTICIGSPRANRLTEMLCCNQLMGIRPFESTKRSGKLIFWMQYRQEDQYVRSALGGLSGPPGFRGKAQPGIYFRGSDGRWKFLPCIRGARGAGAVVIVRDSAHDQVEMALIGYSGLDTRLLAERLLLSPDLFWDPIEHEGRQYGVQFCSFDIKQKTTSSGETEIVTANQKVLGIDPDLLRTMLPVSKDNRTRRTKE